MSAFFQALVILLREGLEVILLLAALSGYLRKVGAERHLPALGWGAVLAIALSLSAAIAIGQLPSTDTFYLLNVSLIMAAAGVMLYASGWLFIFRSSGRWQGYLRARVVEGASADAWYVMAAVAFVAVMREGVETVLFMHALAQTSGGWSSGLFFGVFAAVACLAVLYVATNALADKLPVRALFLVTSGLLFVMAIRLIGDGVHGLQEQKYISETVIRGGDWVTAIGFNATWEAILAQLLVVAVCVVGVLTFAWRERAGGP